MRGAAPRRRARWWLRGHLYGRPALPPRVMLLGVWMVFYLLGSWVGLPWWR